MSPLFLRTTSLTLSKTPGKEENYHANGHQNAMRHLHSAAYTNLFGGHFDVDYRQLFVLFHVAGNPRISAILPPRTSSLSSESGKIRPIIWK